MADPTVPPLPEPGQTAQERRRPRRADVVAPVLLPLLRGAAFENAKDALDLAPDRVPSRAGKGCNACRNPPALFAFTMAFQPIVDLDLAQIDTHEALVRGPNGQGAAQILGQVTAETLYAFDQACRVKAIELAARLGLDRQLSINFLPNAVYEPRACIQATLAAAGRTGFDPRRLTFEIVETEAIADTPHLLNIINEYKRQGFKVALDDFATGYSGLARLADLKPDIVKLDRALIKDCDLDHTRLAIIASLMRLGREIGLKIVVEGVERAGEVAALRSVGARFMQGFYFAKPMLEGLVREADMPHLA